MFQLSLSTSPQLSPPVSFPARKEEEKEQTAAECHFSQTNWPTAKGEMGGDQAETHLGILAQYFQINLNIKGSKILF